MAKQNINVGTAANDKKGDSLRAAFVKVNANFTELYTALGIAADADLNLGNFVFESNTVRLTNANNDDSTATQIEIAQPVRIESNLTVGGDVVPNTANGGDLGSSTLPWRSLYVSNNTIYIGGTAVGVDANGALTTGGTVVGSTPAWANITGKPTFATVATTGAYADLTGRPTSFNSLVTGAYSVNLESGGVLRANVQGIVSDNQLAVEGSTLISIQTLDGPYLQLFNQGATKEINLVAWDGESLSAPTWSFDTDRTLTLPNDSGIKSATNIDIVIDTPDSSTFNWRFGADGALTFPDGTSQSTAGGGGSIGNISNGTGPTTDPNSLVSSASAAFINFASDLDGAFGLGTNDGSLVKITTDGGASAFEFTADNGAGSIKFPDATVQTTAWTGIANALRSETGIYIDVNLADSTLRRWQFGEDGNLTLPSVGKINNGAYDWTFGSTGNTTFPTGLTLSAARGPNTVNFTSGIDKEFQIETQTNTTGRLWNFSTDGSLTIPGDIKSNSNINIDINLTDSTLRRWSFGEDGILTLPSVGKISNGEYDWTFGTDGRTIFPNGTVPAHSYGAAGDKEGMVVFSDPYIYYCKQDYPTGEVSVNLRTSSVGSGSVGGQSVTIMTIYGNHTDKVGYFIRGFQVTGNEIVQADYVVDATPYTSIYVLDSGVTLSPDSGNNPYTLTPVFPNIWVRVAWTGTNW